VKIAIGTTSEIKSTYFQDVLDSLNIKAKVFPVNTNSGVTYQPRTEKETKLGSINRAKSALEQLPDTEIGVGIEVGYEPINGKMYMHGWTSVVDSEGNTYSEQSSTIELPKYFLGYLHDHEEDGVGYHVQDYKILHNDPVWRHFTEIFQYREPFIKESSRNAILRYIFRKEY